MVAAMPRQALLWLFLNRKMDVNLFGKMIGDKMIFLNAEYESLKNTKW
jgi:hypothetical protein